MTTIVNIFETLSNLIWFRCVIFTNR